MNKNTASVPSDSAVLSVRITKTPFHHLWNNHGTWWCHYTEHLPDFTKRRVRRNLHTDDSHIARLLRDSILLNAFGDDPSFSVKVPHAALNTD